MSQAVLKQFFVNQKVFEDSVIGSIRNEQLFATTGIVVGKREGDKLNIFDVFLTPNPEVTQPNLKQVKSAKDMDDELKTLSKKNLNDLLYTKYKEFGYVHWLMEFKFSVEKLLPTGIEVVGLFIYCQELKEKQINNKKLTSVMNNLFLEEEEDALDFQLEESKRSEQNQKQFVLMSVYERRVGQSLGDINIYERGTIGTLNEQIRNANILDKLAVVHSTLEVNVPLTFDKGEVNMRSFQQLCNEIKEDIKMQLAEGVVKLNKTLYVVKQSRNSLTFEEMLGQFQSDTSISINFGEQGKQGKKGGKNQKQRDQFNFEEFQIPQVKIEFVSRVFPPSKITQKLKHDNYFTFKGTFSLNAVINTEKSTLDTVLSALQEDVDVQFKRRIEVLQDEAENNIAAVNPMNLNTDNMNRISEFNLLIPRRAEFSLPVHVKGMKTKLKMNDYQLFYDTPEEAKRKIQSSLGFYIDPGSFSFVEKLEQKDIDKKLIKLGEQTVHVGKDKGQQGVKKKEEEKKKEKTKEELLQERREQQRIREFKLLVSFFCVSLVGLIFTYYYVHKYLM